MTSKFLKFLKSNSSEVELEALVSTPEITLAEKNSLEFLAIAEKAVVETPEQRTVISKLKEDAWTRQKNVIKFMDPDIAAARKPYQRLLDKKKSIVDPMDKGTRHLAKLIMVFDEKLKKKAEAEKAELLRKVRLEEEARQKEEDEKAEKVRLENERLANEEKARLESQALEHKKDGNEAMANLLQDCAEKVEPEPEPVVAKIEPREPTEAELQLKAATVASKVKTGAVKKYTFTVTNIDAIPRNFLVDGADLYPKQTAAINAVIKAMKGQIEIPGIKIEEDFAARR